MTEQSGNYNIGEVPETECHSVALSLIDARRGLVELVQSDPGTCGDVGIVLHADQLVLLAGQAKAMQAKWWIAGIRDELSGVAK